MASSPAFFPQYPPLTPTNRLKHFNTSHFLFTSNNRTHRRNLLVPSLASSLAAPINIDYLEREFSGRGVSFEGIGDSCVVKMRLENGSVASLMLPSGLITSYKPLMWHGGIVEILHTIVSEDENSEVVIQGGVSMDLHTLNDGGFSWSSNKWALLDVKGSPEKAIQVELISIDPQDMIEVRYLVTLNEDLLGSEVTITNKSPSSSLQLLGSVVSHLTVSTPDATYAVGLQGSNYECKQPVMSNFSIIPPDSEGSSPILWSHKGFDGIFSRWDRKDRKRNEELSEEIEEDDDCAPMTEKMSRIYTYAPREFTIMDRGRRNSVVVRRSGFDEFYILSPGSAHEWYGKYAYVCIGPSALLKPMVLGPGNVWTGAQDLYNPNL